MILEVIIPADSKRAVEVAKRMAELAGEGHPVLTEVSLYMFWGATSYALWDHDLPVSLHTSKFGKRRKNIFEPYWNWYGAFTLPDRRRRGYATQLYRAAEATALERGCRRVKSLAGSAAGLALHQSLGHLCWGQKETGEVYVDSPLPGMEDLYEDKRRPDGALTDRPLPKSEIAHLIKQGLRYDHR